MTVAALDAGGIAALEVGADALEPGAAFPAEEAGCTGEDWPGVAADVATAAEERPGTEPVALERPFWPPKPPLESELTSLVSGPSGLATALESSPQAVKTKPKPTPHSATFAKDFISIYL